MSFTSSLQGTTPTPGAPAFNPINPLLGLAAIVAPLLPQNPKTEHERSLKKQVVDLNRTITILSGDSAEKEHLITQTRAELGVRAIRLVDEFQTTYGEYFGDPNSAIHNAFNAYAATCQAPLEPLTVEKILKENPEAAPGSPLALVKTLGQQKQALIEELKFVGGTMQNDPALHGELLKQKADLEAQLKGIIGTPEKGKHYDDKSKIHLAHGKMLTVNKDPKATDVDKEAARKAYADLDLKKAKLEGQLWFYSNEALLVSPLSKTLQDLTIEKTQQRIRVLKSQIEDAKNNRGIDWGKTAADTIVFSVALTLGFLSLKRHMDS